MLDNFTGDTAEKLIRYMDGELNGDERGAVENLLQNDAAAQEQYRFFLAAKHSIRSQGIRERVAGIQRTYLAERNSSEKPPVTRRRRSSFFTSFMSVAAVLIFLLIGFGTFQYLTTTSQRVYDEAYTGYQLPVSRGTETADRMDDAYNKGNFTSVINSFQTTSVKSQREYFIAGLSYLQLNDAGSAVKTFQQVEALNTAGNKKRYVEETDYYLMLAYLKTGEIGNAEEKWRAIRSNKEHLFYEKASAISRTELMILKWKEK